ncbi:MAG: hypothetical protein JKY54_11075, partial [Flavobacteriales bacterium]|nr:hypothetical protein [Flavobacteriales bacterium]
MNKLKNWKIFIALLSLLVCFGTYANNVSIQNVSLTGQNTVADYKQVKMDISWDNSWRTSATPNNWDAVWVFCKYRLTSGSVWSHATLNTSAVIHTAATGSTMAPSSDGLG